MINYDDLSLLEIFQLDADERLKKLNKLILEIESSWEDTAIIEDAMRETHSLKGASRIVDAKDVQEISHHIETVLLEYKHNPRPLFSAQVDFLLNVCDQLNLIIKSIVQEVDHDVDVSLIIDSLSNFDKISEPEDSKSKYKDKNKEKEKEKEKQAESNLELEKQSVDLKDDSAEILTKANDIQEEPPSEQNLSDEAEKALTQYKSDKHTIRLNTRRLDKLMNLSGELYTYSLNLTKQHEIFNNSFQLANKLLSHWNSVTNLLDRKGTLDLISFNEWQNKGQSYIENFETSLLSCKESLDHISLNINQLGGGIYNEVMQARMLPAETLLEPLARNVRDLSKSFNKSIKLDIEGKDTLMDRGVIEILQDPLMHLIRNSCDHGIESTALRKEVGKPAEGHILVSARQRGDQIIISVKDDGKGLSVEKIQKRIQALSLETEEEVFKLSDEKTFMYLFMPGFSTAAEVSNISGRGVGLDIVKQMVEKIGGTVHVFSEEGTFTEFVIYLPLTLATNKCLLGQVGDETFCFPMTRLVEVLTIRQEDIKIINEKQTIYLDNSFVQLIDLEAYTNLRPMKQTAPLEEVPVIVFNTPTAEKLAFRIRKFIGEQELLSKALDPRLHSMSILRGSTILENGSLAYVIDVDQLLIVEWSGVLLDAPEIIDNESEEENRTKSILIVEDSLTVRELEKKVVKNHGYDVDTAVDGLDALSKLKIKNYDLMVTDIEMPRMNGIELIQSVRNDLLNKSMPIIILSFRENDEDKRRGLDVGADLYLTKSKYENKGLIEAIERFVCL